MSKEMTDEEYQARANIEATRSTVAAEQAAYTARYNDLTRFQIDAFNALGAHGGEATALDHANQRAVGGASTSGRLPATRGDGASALQSAWNWLTD